MPRAAAATTPHEAAAHLRQTLVSYLETAYKLGDPALAAERRALLEEPGSIWQTPYLESTPAYPEGRLLSEICAERPDDFPTDLVDLLSFGSSVGKLPLWQHQEQALLASQGDAPNLV